MYELTKSGETLELAFKLEQFGGLSVHGTFSAFSRLEINLAVDMGRKGCVEQLCNKKTSLSLSVVFVLI